MIGKHQDRTITTNDRRKVVVPAVCWGLMLLFAGADPGKTMGARDDTPSRLTYEHHVRSILKAMCFHCHGEEQELPGGMELCLVRLMRVGGDSGPAIVPGDAASSLLWQQIDADEMPKGSKKLTANQKRIINKSINQGAATVRPEPDHVEDARFTPEELAHWAFQPVTRPPVPAPAGYRLLSPIDGFVAVRLAEHSLPFSPAADRHTLIRRATLDLTGLPPTPAEVDTFVADKAPDAYERLIDRLLASPQYGERWGRFWLDVARYSDSNGLDENIAHGNAWRYRDYVIAAFNSDKPYDRFLHEQLAGDLMEAGDHATRVELNIATGFLSLGPKVLAEQDVVKMTLDIIDEQIDTIGRSLMGLTLGCSRCHDHKFDPLTTRDYYALAGIFKSTRTMESFKALARWNETSIARPEQQRLFDEHQQKIEAAQKVVEETTKAANEQFRKQLGPDAELPEKPGEKYPEETKKKLAMQQAALKQLEESLPTLPMAMGVVDQEVTDLAVHIRGSHLSLGEIVPRRVPELLSHVGSSPFDRQQSGRRELAAWLTHPDHPLTSRVMANRIWRWHFGRGIVSSTDNFGKLGAAPTHPDLLDHLASGMVERGWSIKQVHRCIMLSSTYRMSSRFDGRSARLDPANQWLWRFPLRRLEAEAMRDSLLAVSGLLDLSMGGSMLHVGNREFVFDHTSIDKTKYDSTRRSVYLPVVRNHLFDLFSLFDYADASMINGNRSTSTIAPQALFMMNSDLIQQVTQALAELLLAEGQADDPPDQLMQGRLAQLYLVTLGRLPRVEESRRAKQFLGIFLERPVNGTDQGGGEQQERLAWQALCQVLLASNEFIYVR